jgi:putative ABC transport system ATP-binding protein
LQEKNWNKPVRSLSIGQQQRIAIARALINKPTLLIADELTSSIDQENRDTFMALLMSIVEKHRIALLFVSHDISLSHYITRVESLNEINQIECEHAN